MRPGFYAECAKIKAWMAKNRESVIGTTDYPDWTQIANLPLTIGADGATYAHFLKDLEGPLRMSSEHAPKRVTLLEDGKEVPFNYAEDCLTVDLPATRRGTADDVVKIEF